MNTANNSILVGGAAVFRRLSNSKTVWLLVGEESGGWEIPKSIVRKGESSVRAVLRAMGEQGGITCRVLEEVGRIENSFEINEKETPRRIIYYLVLAKNSGEMIGFNKSSWFSFGLALRRLNLDGEKKILKQAKIELEKWILRQRK